MYIENIFAIENIKTEILNSKYNFIEQNSKVTAFPAVLSNMYINQSKKGISLNV